MILSLPCTYLQGLTMLIVLPSKLVAKKRMSLVMSMLVLTSLMTVGSLAYIINQNFQIYKNSPDVLSILFLAVPVATFVTQLVFNLLMCIVHRKVLSTALCTIPRWVYLPSVLMSYHCLSLSSITFKTNEPTEKHSQTLKNYLKCYRMISQLNLYIFFIPTSFVLVY
jgi:hypothetical protein